MTVRDAIEKTGCKDAVIIFKTGDEIDEMCEIKNGVITRTSSDDLPLDEEMFKYSKFETRLGNIIFVWRET